MHESGADDWYSASFGSLCLRIVNGGTPETGNAKYWDGDTPWITGADFTAGGIGEFRRFVSEAGLRSSATSVVKQGNLLVVTRTGVGKLAIAPCDIAISQDITGIYVDRQKAETGFIFYLLSRELDELKKLNQGTSINGIIRADLEKHLVRLPAAVSTQRKIATILSSIDTAIEKTEALIAKYQQIKAGMMHDLFTCGVLPNGQLRPPRSEAPELYQETPVGWIPTAWCFTTCAKVCEKIIDCKNRTPPETPDGFPVIRTPNVRNGKFVDAELLYTDERSYLTWTLRGKPQVGDIVITREAPVGEVCMIPDRHSSACLGQRMMLYRPDAELISPRYFLYALQSRQIKNRLDLISGGSTVGHVRVGDIRNLWMFMPTDSLEQIQIADALDGITVKLDRELEQLGKLRKQKLGLMHDLLTGRVPVQVEEPAPEMANG